MAKEIFKDTLTEIQKLDTIKQNDAWFDQDRYMPNINYVTTYLWAFEEDPVAQRDGDTYYNITNNELRIFVSFVYNGIGIPTWIASTVYNQGDIIDYMGRAYQTVQTHTSWTFFEQQYWKQVTIVRSRQPA